jgi:pimeloyl-ACP methyl ester carboxylesterase
MSTLEAEDRSSTFTTHRFAEQIVDLGEVRMNYSTLGDSSKPALLLIPSQTESWWGYEDAMPLLAGHFQTYAVDLRGQGRSSWTPGRYTLDNMGNDLVRFIDLVIGRPTLVSGNSSGGLVAAWLSAFARPGQIRGAVWEDAPLFASEVNPECGQSSRQALGPIMDLWSKWLGDQWSIGDWSGMQAAAPNELPFRMVVANEGMRVKRAGDDTAQALDGPPQNFKEYDPEWARAFSSGTAMSGSDHARMLESVRVPVLFTHHFHQLEAETGALMGAISDVQIQRVRDLVTAAGQPFDYFSFPEMAHQMHEQDPELFARLIDEWAAKLA